MLDRARAEEAIRRAFLDRRESLENRKYYFQPETIEESESYLVLIAISEEKDPKTGYPLSNPVFAFMKESGTVLYCTVNNWRFVLAEHISDRDS